MLADHEQVQLDQLRRTLAEKFPSAEQKSGGVLPTGISEIDRFEGGLRRAAITEVCGPCGGGAMLMDALTRTLTQHAQFIALVDAGCSFEVEQSFSRLLWILCKDAMQAIKATDLLLRDGNLSLLLLDLQFVPAMQLRRIPANTWHRFQRLIEQNSMAVMILTPQPMVEAAHVRMTTDWPFGLDAQRRRRDALHTELPLQFFNRRQVRVAGAFSQPAQASA